MTELDSISIAVRCARMFRFGKMDTAAMAQKLQLPESTIYGYLHVGLCQIPQTERSPHERSDTPAR